ncbi:serine hydrolase domain-containing protein [Exiguobacterium mexicanum]|uniref:serine hydrolase domain-containing protein n=1 Tax=Exiguobacterium mexicanum TaxID=340146 RepID=UPI001BED15A2
MQVERGEGDVETTYSALISYVKDIQHLNQSSAAALLVLQDDRIVFEHYDGFHSNHDSKVVDVNSMFNVASARKSYLGLAIAYALYEGKIRHLDDLVSDYFDEYDVGTFRGTTIRHLVTHSHGLNQDETGLVFREFDAGEGWAYQGVNVEIVTNLFKRLYGYDFTHLLRERVFQPMGLSRTEWATRAAPSLVKVVDVPDEEASYKLYPFDDGMGSNLHTTAREFAAWGNLHLNNGRHRGVQIVPEEVIRLATSIQSPEYANSTFPTNGLFWYVQGVPKAWSELGEAVPTGSYQILGNTGPLLLVIPAYRAVVVRMYNKRYNYGGDRYLDYLREFSNLAAETLRPTDNPIP